jgi:hypothetical protein
MTHVHVDHVDEITRGCNRTWRRSHVDVDHVDAIARGDVHTWILSHVETFTRGYVHMWMQSHVGARTLRPVERAGGVRGWHQPGARARLCVGPKNQPGGACWNPELWILSLKP